MILPVWIRAAVPNHFGTRDQSHEDNFSTDSVGRGGFGMIQVHYIYCVLYFYYYYIVIYSEIIIQLTIMLIGGGAQGVA